VGIPATYLTSIGVFFKAKSSVLGVTLAVVATNNGYPDTNQILGGVHLNANQVTVSDDSSAETIFTFVNPLVLDTTKLYSFYVLPDSNNPDYALWISSVGGTDILTGIPVTSQPYSGTLFTSSNQQTWIPIVSQNFKFNLYRAKFNNTNAKLVFRNNPTDYLQLTSYQRANSSIGLAVGDVVYAANTSNTAQILSNTSIYPYGTVSSFNELSQFVEIKNTNGLFNTTTYPILNFFRVKQYSNASLLTPNNMIATANLISIVDQHYQSLVPKFTLVEPSGTSTNMAHYGTANSDGYYAYDTNQTASYVTNETRYDLNDHERVILSYSNEVAIGGYGANGSSTIVINLQTASQYASPVIDLGTKAVTFIENNINNLLDNESTRYGDALNKYISQTISMDITAEDFKVYVTGYRPAGTDIVVYGRFKNNHDGNVIQYNPWSKMVMDPSQVSKFSSPKNKTDFNDYTYTMAVGNTVVNQTIAYMDPNADIGSNATANCLTYYNTTGASFVGFDNFQIKMVLTSSDQIKVPTVKTLAAIALLQ